VALPAAHPVGIPAGVFVLVGLPAGANGNLAPASIPPAVAVLAQAVRAAV